MSIEQYNKLKPSIYKFSGEKRFKMGFIAQDVLRDVSEELINYIPNENMKPSDDPNDLDGVQLSIDYNQLAALNTSIIKKMIKKIEDLEDVIQKLISRPVTAKWLSKSSKS